MKIPSRQVRGGEAFLWEMGMLNEAVMISGTRQVRGREGIADKVSWEGGMIIPPLDV